MIRLDGQYYTVKEFQNKIGFAQPQAVYNAIKDGRLEHVRIGRQILIPKNAVLLDKRVKSGKYIGIRRWLDEQITNASDLPMYENKVRGLSTPRPETINGKRYYENGE